MGTCPGCDSDLVMGGRELVDVLGVKLVDLNIYIYI
jgi:hypothetical protein